MKKIIAALPVSMFAWTFALAMVVLAAPAALAGGVKSYSKKAEFDDIRFELTNAIIDRGLKVQTNGKLAAMLKRTGADLGNGKAIYKHAEYFSFCSAKLSRAMMEADPLNAAYCPFVMSIIVSTSKPDEVTVSYQKHPTTGNPASIKAFAAIDKMLDQIARQVME